MLGASATLFAVWLSVAASCPIVEWQQEVRNNWLCAGGCWNEEWCRHGCSHTMHWDIPRGYYVARAWLTAAAYGDLETVSGYADYEMAEAHHDLEGTESYGERRYGGHRGGWFDETQNARGHPDTDPEQVRTYVDSRIVSEQCNATEPREWQQTESLLADGFPSSRDYTSHTYETPPKILESYENIPEVPASAGKHNLWTLCADRIEVTDLLKSRTGPRIEVTMATAHSARGHPTRYEHTQNAGKQAYDRGPYRFKSRATLFLHLAPENSIKPYLGPAYGTTHIHIRPECMTKTAEYPDEKFENYNENTSVICRFGEQPTWQGGFGRGFGLEVLGVSHDDGSVDCISPDMSSNLEWQEVAVFHHINGSGPVYDRISHAIGFYTYRHAPRHQSKHAQVNDDLSNYAHSSVFSHRQGPALQPGNTVMRSKDYPGNQFEYGERRLQPNPSGYGRIVEGTSYRPGEENRGCPDRTDTDC